MATAQPTTGTITPAQLRDLDRIIIELDKCPPEPSHTWLRLLKAELERFIPTSTMQRHEVEP